MAGRNSEVRVAIVADNSSLNTGLQQSQSKLASFGKAVGKVALAAGAAAAVGLGALAKASIEAASEAQQSLGGTQAVFGKFADQVIRDSNRAANAFGLSANEYRTSANIIGSLLVNQGVQQSKLRGSTKDLITSASDLAATYGGKTKDAVDALASAFKGEFDPLQNYGITLKQSTINVEAMRVAHVKTVTEFNKLSAATQTAAKRQATSNLITKQATVAQGQFRKQTKTLAEQQQILGAQWDNLKAKIGKALLPTVTRLFVMLNQDLMPALSKLARKYLPEVRKALDDWTKSGGAQRMVTDLGDALEGIDWAHVSDGLGDVGDSLKELGPALKDASVSTVADGFSVLGIALGFAADHADTLKKILPALVLLFGAYKVAQLANNIAGRDSVVGLILQIAQTRALTVANRDLAASLTQLNANMGGTTAASAKAAGGFSKMGAAAKVAAGAAGLGLLMAGAHETDKSLSTLETTAGGAALGWSVAGPWGAAIGGAAGLMFGLSTKTDTVTQSLDGMREAAEGGRGAQLDLRDALNQTTGAMTEQARQSVSQDLFNQRLGKSARDLGIPMRDLVSAVLGQGPAFDRVTAAVDKWKNAGGAASTSVQNKMSDAAVNIGAYLGGASAKFRKTGREIRAVADGTESWGKALKGLPKELKVDLRNKNYRVTIAEVRNLARQYKLNPKKLETRLRLAGVDVVKKQARDTKKALEETGKVKPDLAPFRRSMDEQLHRFGLQAEGSGKTITNNLKRETGKARADLSPFQRGLQQALTRAKGAASEQAGGIGIALKSGVLAGIGGLGTALSAQMAAAVNQGIAAARQAADAHSPSRKMLALGLDLTRGLIRGVQRGSAGVEAALRVLSEQTTRILSRQLGQRQQAIRQHFKGKEEAKRLRELSKSWATHTKAVTKATKDERKALQDIGKAQDALQSGNFLGYLDKSSRLYKRMREAGVKNLEQARARLQELKSTARGYADNIKASFVAFGDITSLGINQDTGGVDIKQLVDQLQTRVVQAQRFDLLVRKLQKEGLNKTQIDQLLAAGPEAGLATAEAIQSALDTGQPDIIAQLNQMSNQIKAAGVDLSDTLVSRYYSAGIKAAQGLVDGLNSKADALDKTAVHLANALVRAIKQALGIKSPSAVMRTIGLQVSQGLALGVQDTYATRAGSSLAGSLVSAFGSPTLGATAPGAQPMRVAVTLTAQQVSQLERGRAIQFDLDAYQRAGGRRRL